MEHVEPLCGHADSRKITLAAAQPEYQPLVAYVDAVGVVLTEWQPSAEDLAALLAGGRLQLWTHTFNPFLSHPRGARFLPIQMTVAQPDGAPASELDVDPQRKRLEALELFVQRCRLAIESASRAGTSAGVAGDLIVHLQNLDAGE
jgi:hypothetical protein